MASLKNRNLSNFLSSFLPFITIFTAIFLNADEILAQPASDEFVATQSRPLKFAIIGDFGSETTGGGANEAKVSTMVKSWKPEFVITTGDNNYPNGEADTLDQNVGKQYRDFIYGYKGKFFPTDKPDVNRFFPALGNHDWDCAGCVKKGNPKPYTDFFDLPGNERYYSFSWGNAEFFVIDSDPRAPDMAGGKNSKQAKWLEKELKASDSLFRIVYFHHPPYSSGKHGPSPHMQWPFAKWGASVVLSGHDHTYERLVIDGIPFVVIGTSGKELYPFNSKHEGSMLRDNSGHGAILVEDETKALVFRYFLSDGKFIDSFRIKARLQERFKPKKSRSFGL